MLLGNDFMYLYVREIIFSNFTSIKLFNLIGYEPSKLEENKIIIVKIFEVCEKKKKKEYWRN